MGSNTPDPAASARPTTSDPARPIRAAMGLMGELTLSEDGRPLSLAEAVARSRAKAEFAAAENAAHKAKVEAAKSHYACSVAREVAHDVLGFDLDWRIEVRDGLRLAVADWDGVLVEAGRDRLFIVSLCPEGHRRRFVVHSGDQLAAALEAAGGDQCDKCAQDRDPAEPSLPPSMPSCTPQERALLDALLDTVRLYTEPMR